MTKLSFAGPPYYDYGSILNSEFSDNVKGELIRFLLTLSIWETTPGEKKHNAQWVWQNSLEKGHHFADELDDFFCFGWREAEEWPETYNFAFPARFLPRFNTPKDDLSLSLKPTFAVPEALEDFRETLKSILDDIPWDNVRMPSDSEILYDRKTTTSYNKDTKERGIQWHNSMLHPEFEVNMLVGDRCKVQTVPGSVRDTVIADIRANHSIRWIERTFRHILEYVEESADCLYSSTYLSRLKNYKDKDGYHALRDIKKCGITYNVKDLFPIIFEEISERKPDDRWQRSNIYKDIRYHDNGSEFVCKRGYCLGMANHVVTLCNIVISRMARARVYSRIGNRKVSNVTIVGNDDLASVFFPKNNDSRKLAEDYMNNEHEIHASLGNITNQKKSVVASAGLFYENYTQKGWKNKESLVCNAIACAYLAPDIRTAKLYISSQSDRFCSPWAFSHLRQLAEYWGPEFYNVETELYVTAEIGGWMHQTSYSLSTALVDLDLI
jgi:hypothetical protein